MPHKVDKRALTPFMQELGKQACMDLRPMTLITPFRVTPAHKLLFPERQSFVFDTKADGVYLMATEDYNRFTEEYRENVEIEELA